MRYDQLLTCGRPLIDVVDGQIGRGVTTGADEALILDKPARDRLVILEPRCAPLLRRVLRGVDLHPWHCQDQMRYLLLLQGVEPDAFAPIQAYLEPLRARLEARNLDGRRWFEPLEVPPLALQTPARLAWSHGAAGLRCSLVPPGPLLDGGCGFALTDSPFLLGLLGSRLARWLVARIPAGAGADPVARLPVPDTPAEAQAPIGRLAEQLSAAARERYELEQRVYLRTLRDLAPLGAQLSPPLHAWWTLDFAGFRAELRRSLKNDIPERHRAEWEVWLAEQSQAHAGMVARSTHLTAELDGRVGDLFGLRLPEQEHQDMDHTL
jgi:hypothetical protein